ncbi:Replication-associated recombination protein A [Marinomonas spartinae]|uniref:Replication-associated recombination protein A n=1 Tax=Marinomonas spartinae TaxID=1792290 RepID=A0A1A8TAQ1_9GAMM|nr:replication-associated recombination protein A [Marinomonas spartinae]SBS27416.1 Replication-associated recombination protein A [Marinomonas spartinae]SBS28816.1 Replication-associated recombination protein A [Marinomonas spartinae]
MEDLFAEQQAGSYQPLAARMRPRQLSDYIGQSHLVGDGRPLRRMVETGHCHSFILWGPPGVGKTTFAQLLSHALDAQFIELSAVMSGVKDIRAAVDQAKQMRMMRDVQTVLFVDEVHRFNKSQQDAFLPYIEDGTFLFIGATTENPAFELNSALLSRARVYRLKTPSVDDIKVVLQRALADSERGIAQAGLQLSDNDLSILAQAADGDIRRGLNFLEILSDFVEPGVPVTHEHLEDVLGGSVRRFDRGGDAFYDQISAFHKSVRGSSPDGALYWMARMLDGGCDPLYIARRLLAIASEDIGNADPRALQIGLNAWDIFERVGPGEGNRAIAQAAVYMACAPKSNAVYKAFNQAMSDVSSQPSYEVPVHLRNAPTALAKNMGHGETYRYAHNEEHAYAAGENYLPEEVSQVRYYHPSERGLEKKIADKLEWLSDLDASSLIKRYPEDH